MKSHIAGGGSVGSGNGANAGPNNFDEKYPSVCGDISRSTAPIAMLNHASAADEGAREISSSSRRRRVVVVAGLIAGAFGSAGGGGGAGVSDIRGSLERSMCVRLRRIPHAPRVGVRLDRRGA